MPQTLPFSKAVDILQQCVAGLHHLHTLGIVHRDFRAANILIAGRDPLHVVVADFGVSHQLHAWSADAEFPGLGTATGKTAGTVLKGDASLCPIAWMAPEVLAGSTDQGRVATPASDVYMLGGLMFEVLTGGTAPFHWSLPALMWQRRRHPAGEMFRPKGIPVDVVGLQDQSVIIAAVVDGVDVQWRVDGDIRGLVTLMERCLDATPGRRPKLGEVQDALMASLAAAAAATGDRRYS